MPVIPFADPVKSPGPSSPVPISSSSRAAIQAEALGQFGEALTKVGDILGKSINQSYRQQQQLDLEEGMNTFDDHLAKAQMAQAAAAPIADDPDGSKTFSAFKTNLQDPINQIAEGIADPETRRMFQINAQKKLNETGLHIYASEAKKRVGENERKFGVVINQYSNKVRNDDSQLEDTLKRAEILVRNSPDIMPAHKEDMVLNTAKSIVRGAFDGAVARQQYAKATAILDKYSGHFSSDHGDEMGKLREMIEADRYKQAGRITQEAAREDAVARIEYNKNTRESINQFLGAMTSGDPQEALAARRVLQDKVEAGLVDGAKANRILNSTATKSALNNAFMATVAQGMLSGELTPERAGDMMLSLPVGSVDEQTSRAMIMGTAVLGQKINADPSFKQQVKDGAAKIEHLKTLQFPGSMSAASASANSARINSILSQYYSGLIMNNNISQKPGALADSLLQQAGYSFGSTSAQEIKQQQQAILQQAMDLKAKGLLTKDAERAAQQKIIDLQSRAHLLNSKESK